MIVITGLGRMISTETEPVEQEPIERPTRTYEPVYEPAPIPAPAPAPSEPIVPVYAYVDPATYTWTEATPEIKPATETPMIPISNETLPYPESLPERTVATSIYTGATAPTTPITTAVPTAPIPPSSTPTSPTVLVPPQPSSSATPSGLLPGAIVATPITTALQPPGFIVGLSTGGKVALGLGLLVALGLAVRHFANR